jgi:hypothetical protein
MVFVRRRQQYTGAGLQLQKIFRSLIPAGLFLSISQARRLDSEEDTVVVRGLRPFVDCPR